MDYQDFKKTMSEEVQLFKNGYEHIPFQADENSKAHHYLGKIFEKLNPEKSSASIENTNIGNKVVFHIHKDDLAKIMYCLNRIYNKTKDKDIIDWVNDIKYHFLHFKKGETT